MPAHVEPRRRCGRLVPGGGLGWNGRQYGLQCSALTAVEVVLGDGTFVRATDDSDSELLWAARGGGGGFGVVTAVEFDLLPVSSRTPACSSGTGRARGKCCASGPNGLDLPDVATTVTPVPGAGRCLAARWGARTSGAGHRRGGPRKSRRGRELLAPLRALRPEIDTFSVVPAASLADLHLKPEEPTAVYANSTLLGDLPDDAIEALVATAGPGSGSRLLFVEVRQLGGALSRPSPRGGALDRMDGSFLVLGVGADEDPAGWPALRDDAGRVLRALEPWGSGGLYLSMVDDEADSRRGWPRS